MNEQTKPTSIRVEDPELLSLCSQVKALRKEANAAQQQLNERFEAEAKALDEGFSKRHDELWNAIYAKAGIDPEGSWTIDTEYVEEHGIAFIKPDDRCSCGTAHGAPGGLGEVLGRLFGGGGVAHFELVEDEQVEEPTIQ